MRSIRCYENKILVLWLSLVLHPVKSGFTDILSQITNVLTQNMTNVEIDYENLERILKSGCWCYFDIFYTRGKGQSLWEIDNYCRDLVYGYECFFVDLPECFDNPWSTEYDGPFTEDYHDYEDTDDLWKICSELNGSEKCKTLTCLIESHFVNQVVGSLFVGLGGYRNEISHDNLDFSEECKYSDSDERRMPKTSKQKSCCGYYPFRFPFDNKKGKRFCDLLEVKYTE